MPIDVYVGGPWPCWVEFSGITDERRTFRIRHTDLLQLEHAVQEAKRQVLCKLARSDWHEVDPMYARVEK